MTQWLKVNSLEPFPLPYDEGRGVWMPWEYSGEYLLDPKAKQDLIDSNIEFETVEREIIKEN